MVLKTPLSAKSQTGKNTGGKKSLVFRLFFFSLSFSFQNIFLVCASLKKIYGAPARSAFARDAHLFRHSRRAPLATANLRADDQSHNRARMHPSRTPRRPKPHAPTAPVVLRKYGPEPLRAAQREQHQDVLVRARDARRSLKALDPGRPSGRLAVQDAHVLGWEELQPARVQAHRGLGGGSVRRGHVGRTPAPVRKPVVEVGGGALGPALHLEEPLP